MKRNVIVFGLLTGVLCSIWMLFSVFIAEDEMLDLGMWIGYTTMILSFSLIFVAIKNYRDKYNGGSVTFGKAFLIGLYIALIASTMYVLAWMIDFSFFNTDFMEKYTQASLKKMEASGMSAVEVKAKAEEMAKFGKIYKENALFRAAITYSEILPVGLIVSLIAAAILKRRKRTLEGPEAMLVNQNI